MDEIKYIIRTPKEDNFTRVDNILVNDKSLSLKAKGIMLYILSKPDDWKVYIKEITKNNKDGIDSVRSGINELLLLKYIQREKRRGEDGTYAWEYIINENPYNTTNQSTLDYPDMDYPGMENPTILTTDSTKTDSTKYISHIKEYKLFLQGFNSIVGSSYKGSDKVLKQFEARLKEGYTLKEIATAIKNASNDDYLMGDNEGGKRYLTPEYILRANKLDQWLNAVPKKSGMQLVS